MEVTIANVLTTVVEQFVIVVKPIINAFLDLKLCTAVNNCF